MPAQAVPVLLVLVLTIFSGVADSQGFIHAARIWEGTRPLWGEVAGSALGFAGGAVCYWLALRYLNELGVVAPEIQTLLWFAVTIVGVAVYSGRFLQWPLPDQVVALGVLAGIGWLVLRGGG